MAGQPSKTVLGVRTAPQQVRYAVVERSGDIFRLLNRSSENLIPRPAGFNDTDLAGLLGWIHEEMERILRQNPAISIVSVKVAEFANTNTGAYRLGNYLDAAVLLAATNSQIPAFTRLYNQIGTRRADVKRHSEQRVTRTDDVWNEQMADAIAVAWAALQ